MGEEASDGIARASLAKNEEEALERARFLHERFESDALIEEYIDGRELYVGVLGNKRLTVFPPREIFFGDAASTTDAKDHSGTDDAPRFATAKAKWDDSYRKKWKIRNGAAGPMPAGFERKLAELARRVYRILHIRGVGRIDVRIAPDNEVVVIEANPNPSLAKDDDFAQAAAQSRHRLRGAHPKDSGERASVERGTHEVEALSLERGFGADAGHDGQLARRIHRAHRFHDLVEANGSSRVTTRSKSLDVFRGLFQVGGGVGSVRRAMTGHDDRGFEGPRCASGFRATPFAAAPWFPPAADAVVTSVARIARNERSGLKERRRSSRVIRAIHALLGPDQHERVALRGIASACRRQRRQSPCPMSSIAPRYAASTLRASSATSPSSLRRR